MVPVATDLVLAGHAPWRRFASAFTHSWNTLRDRGAPLPWLRFATIVRVEPVGDKLRVTFDRRATELVAANAGT